MLGKVSPDEPLKILDFSGSAFNMPSLEAPAQH
jgi:hypothetical protein